ncbi:MAG: hypothetical protein HQK83_05875 [Fibrobacteria bacterium]|nr:hypothetical protein [Fibrobacteria bacterium]
MAVSEVEKLQEMTNRCRLKVEILANKNPHSQNTSSELSEASDKHCEYVDMSMWSLRTLMQSGSLNDIELPFTLKK